MDSKIILGWLLGILSALVTSGLGRFLFGPKCAVAFEGSKEEFVLPTPAESGHPNGTMLDAIYVRIRVTNSRGWRRWSIRTARECRGYLRNVERRNVKTGEFESAGYCDSLPLKWSYLDSQDAHSGISIPDSVSQYLNVVCTQSNRPDFVPEIAVAPLRYALFFDPAATMKSLEGNEKDFALRLTIQICAEETKPEVIQLALEWHGKWDNFKAYRWPRPSNGDKGK